MEKSLKEVNEQFINTLEFKILPNLNRAVTALNKVNKTYEEINQMLKKGKNNGSVNKL